MQNFIYKVDSYCSLWQSSQTTTIIAKVRVGEVRNPGLVQEGRLSPLFSQLYALAATTFLSIHFIRCVSASSLVVDLFIYYSWTLTTDNDWIKPLPYLKTVERDILSGKRINFMSHVWCSLAGKVCLPTNMAVFPFQITTKSILYIHFLVQGLLFLQTEPLTLAFHLLSKFCYCRLVPQATGPAMWRQ